MHIKQANPAFASSQIVLLPEVPLEQPRESLAVPGFVPGPGTILVCGFPIRCGDGPPPLDVRDLLTGWSFRDRIRVMFRIAQYEKTVLVRSCELYAEK